MARVQCRKFLIWSLGIYIFFWILSPFTGIDLLESCLYRGKIECPDGEIRQVTVHNDDFHRKWTYILLPVFGWYAPGPHFSACVSGRTPKTPLIVSATIQLPSKKSEILLDQIWSYSENTNFSSTEFKIKSPPKTLEIEVKVRIKNGDEHLCTKKMLKLQRETKWEYGIRPPFWYMD